MHRLHFILLILLPMVLFAQSGINVTGRISLRTINTGYDQTSKIKPDSIPEDQYAKTSVIPGLEEQLNLAIFARTSSMDITLLGDLRNNPWNTLSSIQNINRLSLTARFGQNEIVLGDFFDSGSEFFIQSREVRGAKAKFRWNRLWNAASYFETKFSGGQIQKAYGIGARLKDLYRQYETAGQYRRYFGSVVAHIGDINLFDVGLKYLYGKDDSKSVDQSINEPLTNSNMGASAKLYLWKKHLQLFSEGYYSRKDTLSATGINDHAYKAGLDFRYEQFKLVAFYQRLGYDYYSVGYPFLQNDRKGFKLNTGYYVPGIISFTVEGEQYSDNLRNEATTPTVDTRLANAGFTTHFKNWPELTLKARFRDDNSNTILDTVKTQKISRGLEGGLAYGLGSNRISASMIYIDLDDKSILVSGAPLGTKQIIASLNFYTRPADGLFISGGSVYSSMKLTNGQTNANIYAYTSGRWDIIPRKLKFEANVNFIRNDAAHGGNQDMLSNYNQLGSELSLEYFFNSNISFKLIGGKNFRHMGYSLAEAQQVIADPDYGPTFFNGYETYDAMRYGAELNWIF